nr:calpain-2 catalytic subunit-like isoform X2 [Salvelinus alpinus]
MFLCSDSTSCCGWYLQEIFKSYDSDRSGTMSSHEMRGALTEAGFHINSAVLQVIVTRYASAHYAIDFHCFVDCLIRVEMLFNMFKTLDTNTSGKIELDVSQWLCWQSTRLPNASSESTRLPSASSESTRLPQ